MLCNIPNKLGIANIAWRRLERGSYSNRSPKSAAQYGVFVLRPAVVALSGPYLRWREDHFNHSWGSSRIARKCVGRAGTDARALALGGSFLAQNLYREGDVCDTP